jgi:hypothetical protein
MTGDLSENPDENATIASYYNKDIIALTR